MFSAAVSRRCDGQLSWRGGLRLGLGLVCNFVATQRRTLQAKSCTREWESSLCARGGGSVLGGGRARHTACCNTGLQCGATRACVFSNSACIFSNSSSTCLSSKRRASQAGGKVKVRAQNTNECESCMCTHGPLRALRPMRWGHLTHGHACTPCVHSCCTNKRARRYRGWGAVHPGNRCCLQTAPAVTRLEQPAVHQRGPRGLCWRCRGVLRPHNHACAQLLLCCTCWWQPKTAAAARPHCQAGPPQLLCPRRHQPAAAPAAAAVARRRRSRQLGGRRAHKC